MLLGALLIDHSVIAQTSRVVTIHVDGQTASFPTDAKTVKRALEVASVEVGSHDLVEPEADTPIITDTFNINVYRARPVLVIDGDKRIETVSPYQSPKLIAEQAGLTIYPEDNFKLERITDFIGESTLGLKLTVIRAIKLKLSLYGTTKDIRTQASTVGELLDQYGLEPSKDDLVRPKPESKIKAGMTVHVIRVSGDTVVKEEVVPFGRREIRDTTQLLGYEKVKSAGTNGSKLVTYKVTYENGKEASRKVLSSVVTEQPIDEVVIVGAKAPNVEGNAEIGRIMAAKKGWDGAEWTCLYRLWWKESKWSHVAANPSGAYGIPQALPGSKMSSAGSDWATNPSTQIKWGLGYIAGRYGTPCSAWNHFLSAGWY